MSKQRAKGTKFETAVAEYLRLATVMNVERNPLYGDGDRGDLRGLTIKGEPVTIECKNTKKLELSDFLNQAEKEAANNLSDYAIVIWKRPGIGIDNPIKTADHAVIMTLSTFTQIVNAANGKD